MNAFLSGSGIKEKGPDPKIYLIVHPQQNVIIPVDSVVWLHCVANFTIIEPDYDYANDDPSAMGDFQFPSPEDFQQSDSPSDDSMASHDDFSAYSCKQQVQYQWFHNGKPLDTADSSIAETFCNGSIQLKYSAKAEGIYRCAAETIQSDVGAVVSKASTVKLAGMYHLLVVVV